MPAFLGRPSRDIKLDELTLPECNQFWPAQARISPYEKLELLSVTGGVPRYLELIDIRSSAEDNIRRLLFARNSILLSEFNFIFSDTFGARSEIYRKIIASLVKGSASLTEILAAAAKTKTGDYSAIHPLYCGRSAGHDASLTALTAATRFSRIFSPIAGPLSPARSSSDNVTAAAASRARNKYAGCG